jgi:hypothetical protein
MQRREVGLKAAGEIKPLTTMRSNITSGVNFASRWPSRSLSNRKDATKANGRDYQRGMGDRQVEDYGS